MVTKLCLVGTRGHMLAGAVDAVRKADLLEALLDWLEYVEQYWIANPYDRDSQLLLSDNEYAAQVFLSKFHSAIKEEKQMPTVVKSKTVKQPSKTVPARRRPGATNIFQLPSEPNKVVNSPWQYAYHITGEKKIGKTTFAVEGCKAYVKQVDKPSLAYGVYETMIDCWSDPTGRTVGVIQVLAGIKQAITYGKFSFDRLVVDGVAELYQMCQDWACRKHGVNHPSENEDWGATWTLLRTAFTDYVNELLRLQLNAKCGLIFISHSEWRERKVRGSKQLIKRLESNLPNRCEEIINGKVDGWFVYDYAGTDRVLIIRGNEEVGAGHRIDGHFMTPDGRRINEIHFGSEDTTAAYSLEQFLKAFNNTLEYVDFAEQEAAQSTARKRTAVKRKKVVSKRTK